MTFVRTFQGYRPLARYEDPADPFIEVDIEEAPPIGGAFTVIDTIELDPADADVTRPVARSFTTELAALNPARYRLVWRDESDATFTSPEIYFDSTAGIVAWRPGLVDVAAVLRARTRDDDSGDEQGAFSADSRPTAVEVTTYIGNAVGQMLVPFVQRVGVNGEIPPELHNSARWVAAVHAAMQAEMSYEPDDLESVTRADTDLKGMFDSGMSALLEALYPHGTRLR